MWADKKRGEVRDTKICYFQSDTDVRMIRQYALIYPAHAANSEAGESPQAAAAALYRGTVRMDLMYSIMFGLRSAQESCRVLFAGMLSSF